MKMNIYCDEAGFTGNHLLDSDQPVFAYATVAIEPAFADDCVAEIRRKYRIQGPELKGGSLVKQARGKGAVTEILTLLQGKFRLVVHLKSYALTSKLFEYIFEPALSNCNSIFYEIGFHRFISTLLFTFFRASDIDTGKFLTDFSSFARRGDKTALAAMFPQNSILTYKSNPLHSIGLFAELHRDTIAEEILNFREARVPNWILDVTTTSLYHLLAWWGQVYESLEVTCDESKPIKGDMKLFDVMVGRVEKKTIRFGGKEHPILFNLSKPLSLEQSQNVSGLQLADIVASASAAMWSANYNGLQETHFSEWRDLLVTGLHEDSIWPNLEDADLTNAHTFANTLVLHQLVERSLQKENLCSGIYELYHVALNHHRDFMRETSLD